VTSLTALRSQTPYTASHWDRYKAVSWPERDMGMADDKRVQLARQMITELPRFGTWTRSIRDFTTPYGKLGFRQLGILWALRYKAIPDTELSPTSLATYQQVRPSVITRALTRLEEGGFLERTMDLQDRRRINLTITEKGIEASEYVERLYLDEIARAIGPLTDAELDAMANSVTLITQIVDRLMASGFAGAQDGTLDATL
jgi:DNA-binding MarR family transcriptional regulator